MRNPSENFLFHGFDQLKADTPKDELFRRLWASEVHDVLLALCEALGVSRLEFPEGYAAPDAETPPIAPIEPLLAGLDQALGIRVEFPNPFPEEVGLATTRGIAGHRAVSAIYQAHRIARLVERGGSVLEIGGGLGRTAYYATRFGIVDYTIVDLPMTAVAQAYFLGRTLGDTSISLYGEPPARGVRLIPPQAFFAEERRYDLVVSIDSLPEIEDDLASRYLAAASARAPRFLSINHETLAQRTVREIAFQHGYRSVSRHPYWLRRGYVEELFESPPATSRPRRVASAVKALKSFATSAYPSRPLHKGSILN